MAAAGATLALGALGASGRWAATETPATPARGTAVPEPFVSPPAAGSAPWRVLVALHGMGGDGTTFGRDLVAQARANNWLLVAPTFAYGDYFDPAQVRADDRANLPWLAAFLDGLPARVDPALEPRVLVYGFSRGAQTAHRFATVYPERVRGVVALSAADYTLPWLTAPGSTAPLDFPFGVADQATAFGRPFDLAAFRRVSFLIGVGGRDTRSGDVPRAWDALLGRDRVARARRYALALGTASVPTSLRIDPTGAHGIGAATRDAALHFLATLATANGA